MVTDWLDTTIQALLTIWHEVLNFIPNLVGAIIVFLIGWAISVGVGKLVAEVLKQIQFNKIFEKGTWKTALDKAEIRVSASEFIGAIFKWVLLIVFLIAAVQILGFGQLALFFNSVLNYLPNVIVAAFIFVVAVIIADIVEKIVRASVESVKVGYGYIVGIIIRWSIWVFAILAVLQQLHIEAATWMVQFIQIAFTGLVLALALAFGIGGRDVAKEILESAKHRMGR